MDCQNFNPSMPQTRCILLLGEFPVDVRRVHLMRFLAALSLLLAVSTVALGAGATHTLTQTGASNWSLATWTGGAPDSTSVGDIATYGTATAATTTLDVNVTIGQITKTANAAWTI